jgi:monovalent cation/proton antiporter MnhG/PhaG subunit
VIGEIGAHEVVVGCLLGLAVGLCFVCAVGVLSVRDAYQRLQLCSPITAVATSLIAAAVWIDDPDWQSRIKAALVMVVLFFMNAILSHATARAIRIRDIGHLSPAADEKIPLVKGHGIVGAAHK